MPEPNSPAALQTAQVSGKGKQGNRPSGKPISDRRGAVNPPFRLGSRRMLVLSSLVPFKWRE